MTHCSPHSAVQMTSPGPPCASQPGGSGRLRDPRLAWFVPWDRIGASSESLDFPHLVPKAPAPPGLSFTPVASSSRTPPSPPRGSQRSRASASGNQTASSTSMGSPPAPRRPWRCGRPRRYQQARRNRRRSTRRRGGKRRRVWESGSPCPFRNARFGLRRPARL